MKHILNYNFLLFLSLFFATTLCTKVVVQGRQSAPKEWIQLKIAPGFHEKQISVTFNLRQCNLGELESTFWELSNPKSSKYAQYMTKDEINNLVMCEGDREVLLQFLSKYTLTSIVPRGPSVQVTSSVAVAQEMLETSFFDYEHKTSKKIFTRHVGTVSLPHEVAEIITFISGISEFFHGTKFSPISYKKTPTNYDPNLVKIADPYVTLDLLQYLYGLPTTDIQSADNSLGIAAFDNDYDHEALCRFQDLFNGYQEVPFIEYLGPDGGSDQIESDLDVQYSTAIAHKIRATFDNHAPGEWVLDWAQATVQDDARSYVWSLSYGWPEIWQCGSDIGVNITNCPTGYDYTMYINATDYEIMKLGMMGVSVMVSSGDDGTVGFASNCPLDPNRYYTYASMNCYQAFADANCQCGEIMATYSSSMDDEITCMLPTGTFTGAGCSEFENNAIEICGEAVEEFLSSVFNENGQYCNMSSNIGFTNDSNTHFYFYSNCTCASLTPVVVTRDGASCTIQGYYFNEENGSPFYPDYPTTSPYVTSVGATALQFTDQCSAPIDLPEIYCQATDLAGFSGGGGFSSFQPQPEYQAAQVLKYFQNNDDLPPAFTFNPTMRGYPDVSFNGHNYIVAVGYTALEEQGQPTSINGAINPVSGTSASSPGFAGMVAHLNDELLNAGLPTLGFLNQLLYQMSQEKPATFNDITPQIIPFQNQSTLVGEFTGCTQEYCCEWGFPVSAGWDPATGLGTPNYANILDYIQKMWNMKKRNSN